MTPQEHQLITELFARLKQTPAQAKDAEADQLIRQGGMEHPDALYLLVQTVLIQDMALSQAQHRLVGACFFLKALGRTMRRTVGMVAHC